MNDTGFYVAMIWISGVCAGFAGFCLLMMVGLKRGWISIREARAPINTEIETSASTSIRYVE